MTGIVPGRASTRRTLCSTGSPIQAMSGGRRAIIDRHRLHPDALAGGNGGEQARPERAAGRSPPSVVPSGNSATGCRRQRLRERDRLALAPFACVRSTKMVSFRSASQPISGVPDIVLRHEGGAGRAAE